MSEKRVESRISIFFRLLRINQYVKNFYIFVPFIFAFRVPNSDVYISFLLFCFLTSSVYIFNDLIDYDFDRFHPVKRFRPIASGAVSKSLAYKIFAIFAVFSLFGAFVFAYKVFFIFLLYFFLNILYSLRLKHIPVIDIFVLASGFVIRLYIGSFSGSIELSRWIVIMTFLLSLLVALGKRRDDLIAIEDGVCVRKSIKGYNLNFIDAAMVFMSSVITVSYILYTFSEDVKQHFHSKNLYLTTFFVLMGIFRYLEIAMVENKSGDPTSLILKDRFLQITVFLWLISFLFIAYGFKIHF
ncbi:UbiA prenyltransferase family protein [Hippea jasoniae]|uniref:UbiA prenyltransferase family protein n=1 Tax=Hippea jasoniae TaxID=944479 RepID=UPI002FBE2B4E